MITRKEHMDAYTKSHVAGEGDDARTKLHRAYHAQFVTPSVIALVERGITVPRLLASTDEHLNDIPLIRWDVLVASFPYETVRALKEAGDWLSRGTGVCILKEAARQTIEKRRAELWAEAERSANENL